MDTKRAFWLLLGVFLLPFPLSAHTLDTPDSVMAGPDGSFLYEWVFTVGPGTAFLAAYGWNGVENVLGGLVGDCFCDPELCLLQEGETIELEVFGSLVDPESEGLVQNWIAGCARGQSMTMTRILPFDPTGIEPPGTTSVVALGARPNPSRGAIELTIQLPKASSVALDVLDVTGRRVRGIFSGALPAGVNALSWDGRLDAARHRRSGVYFVRLTTAEGTELTRKLTLLR